VLVIGSGCLLRLFVDVSHGCCDRSSFALPLARLQCACFVVSGGVLMLHVCIPTLRSYFCALVARFAGSGPTVYLASRLRPRGVILVSPLRSALRVVLPGWVVVGCCCCLCDVFPNGWRVGRIGAPVLVGLLNSPFVTALACDCAGSSE
jgi:hypothetical protein